jgi:cellulose biosynthesis protein BcsQ
LKTIAFFNNKGGVGKTSLVYHLAWMYADMGISVIAADLDPQANLTSMFVDDERLEELWPDGSHAETIFGAFNPLLRGTGDIADPHVEEISDRIGLLVGDLALSSAEDELTSQWPDCLDRKERAFRVLSAFWRIFEAVAMARDVDLVLIDVGPNLGAINRATLIAAEHVVIPLAADLYSLQGLRNLGPTLHRWREEWSERRERNPVMGLSIPSGEMRPVGYVLMQHAVRLDRPVKAYERWMARIPGVYRESVLAEGSDAAPATPRHDPHCLAELKHYRSLMPLAMEARKPMFFLTPADGALGGHAQAVRDCYDDFRHLAVTIAERCGISAVPGLE